MRIIYLDPVTGQKLTAVDLKYRQDDSHMPKPSPPLAYEWACRTCLWWGAMVTINGVAVASDRPGETGSCRAAAPPRYGETPALTAADFQCALWQPAYGVETIKEDGQ